MTEHKHQDRIDRMVNIDMYVDDGSSRIVKVQRQNVHETVNVLNAVLQKMNADYRVGFTPVDAESALPEKPQLIPEEISAGALVNDT